jgi:hypothetical protein
MKFSSIITTFLVVISILSCNKYDANGKLIKNYNELQKAKWILGKWEIHDSIGKFVENWVKENDSTYSAVSFFIIGKDTIHREKIQLMEDNEKLLYIPTIEGQHNNQPVTFKLTNEIDTLLIFENPLNDYPQKITYQKNHDNKIIAIISGQENGKAMKESYPFNRVSK